MMHVYNVCLIKIPCIYDANERNLFFSVSRALSIVDEYVNQAPRDVVNNLSQRMTFLKRKIVEL